MNKHYKMHVSSLLALQAAAAALVSANPRHRGEFKDQQQQLILSGDKTSATAFDCDLPPVVSPSGDGLASSEELFSGREAFLKQVERHTAIVQVPSVSYDDNGDVYEDDRWLPFFDLHKVLRELFPSIHSRAKLEKVNRFGLLYTIEGTDDSLQPLLLMAHQDVVPVADASTWTHPPFSAHFDGTWLWGRGSSDDKGSLTALMSAVESLLSNESWVPKRTLILAFGFDEECSGYRGAGHISKYLESIYGPDSMAMILDEGGQGLRQVGDDTVYALPAVLEKGHLDIWLELHVQGGHSSVPFAHTGIGIISEIVTALEAHPYTPELAEGSAIHKHLICQARYSPDAQPEITKLVLKDDIEGLTAALASERSTNFLIQTSQSVDLIQGGQKINAMPEVIRLGVNYRIAPQNSADEVRENVIKHIHPIVRKYSLKVEPYGAEGLGRYADVLEELDEAFDMRAAEGTVRTLWESDYNGTLVLTSSDETPVAPESPTSGPVWDLFSGTIQNTFAFEGGRVVPVGEVMTGNTDTRHYLALSRHVYRWTPTRAGTGENVHTIDERINMTGHLESVKFYYDIIRNFDASDV